MVGMMSIIRAMTKISVTLPATRTVRAMALADYRSAMGFDLSDDERAEMIRARHRLPDVSPEQARRILDRPQPSPVKVPPDASPIF